MAKPIDETVVHPTPWVVVADKIHDFKAAIYDANGRLVVVADQFCNATVADLERMVLCVNACERIPENVLEQAARV